MRSFVPGIHLLQVLQAFPCAETSRGRASNRRPRFSTTGSHLLFSIALLISLSASVSRVPSTL